MKESKLLQWIVGFLGLALILFIGMKARNAAQEYKYIGKIVRDRDVIMIAGEGKVTVQPDLAQIQLGVVTEGATVKETQTRNTEKMNVILAAIKVLGIAGKDIQTTNYSLYPKQEWHAGRSTIIGYRVSQNVTVKVRNFDNAGDVLAKAGELGANQIGGIQFTIDDPSSLTDNARSKAIENARKKAEALAQQLGLTIVKVVTFSESFGGYPQPTPMFERSMGAPMAMESAPAPRVEPGSLDVTANVSVTFEVR